MDAKKELSRKSKLWTVFISLILLTSSQAAKRIAAANPAVVEKYFSRGIYPITSQIQNSIANLFPFSVYELVIIVLILFLGYRLFKLIRSIFRRNFKQESVRFGIQFLLLVSIGLFLFQFLWSLNNYRVPLKDQLGLNVRETSVSQLADTYKALVQKANKYRTQLSSQQIMDRTKVKYILDNAWEGYKPLAHKYSIFHSRRVRVKGLLFSRIQTISGYTGVYNFFTGEPNINTEPPVVTLPHTACHEIAHQMGITLEDEANYAGFLACKNHPDILFKYSGYLSALTYAGNALFSQSPDLYNKLSSLLDDEIKADQLMIREFWNKHQNKTATKIADTVNEAYLKSNNQPEGLKSYGKYVDLLIADYLSNQDI
jgi:hypothetical protein